MPKDFAIQDNQINKIPDSKCQRSWPFRAIKSTKFLTQNAKGVGHSGQSNQQNFLTQNAKAEKNILEPE
jgi:hypothetical protein